LRFPTHKVVVNNEENVKAEKPYEKGYVKYLTDITIAGGGMRGALGYPSPSFDVRKKFFNIFKNKKIKLCHLLRVSQI
jgi:hypothetical protein